MGCKASGARISVDDQAALVRKTKCPTCGKQVKIVDIDRAMFRNMAKLDKHSSNHRVNDDKPKKAKPIVINLDEDFVER